MITYWLTSTGVSAARLYYENAHAAPPLNPPRCRSASPGSAATFYGIRRFAERDHRNIVLWTTYDHGGHFAAHKAPDLYVKDIRQFFRGLR